MSRALRNTMLTAILAAFLLAQGCSPAGGNKRGHEFMPDMVHSIAYEANVSSYYFYNTWGTQEEYKYWSSPRKAVPGTVARGQISAAGQADMASRVMALEAFDGTTISCRCGGDTKRSCAL